MIPPGGMIAESHACYVHHDPEVPIVGFIVIGSKRHIQSVTDMTTEEYTDFSSLLRSCRTWLQSLPNIRSITLIQEERSRHFHLWLFPWYDWMIDQYGSMSLTHIRTIMHDAKQKFKTPQEIQHILHVVDMLRKMAD